SSQNGRQRDGAPRPLLLLPFAIVERTDARRAETSVSSRPLLEQLIRCRCFAGARSASARGKLARRRRLGFQRRVSGRLEASQRPTLYPGWPLDTTDAFEVVFALGSGTDYATIEDPPTGQIVSRSNLSVVDVVSRHARPLDLANGRNLPARDQNLNYYPTVSP